MTGPWPVGFLRVPMGCNSDRKAGVLMQGTETSKYLNRWLTAGSGEDVEHEIRTSLMGRSSIDYDMLRSVFRSVLEAAVPCVLSPLPWSIVVREKGLDKSLGAPLQFTYGVYRKFMGALIGKEITAENIHEGYLAMAQYMEVVEEQVLIGVAFITAYAAAPKNDTHNWRKLSEEKLRSLCGPGIVSLLLCSRWLGAVDSHYKEFSEHAYGIQNPRAYMEKTAPLRSCFCFGLDFTGFDKTIPVDMVVCCLEAFADRSDIRSAGEGWQHLYRFLVRDIASPLVVCPTGNVVLLCGSNPSGIRLTSGLNNAVHETAALIVRKLLNCYFEFVVTGDDSIYGHPELGESRRLMHALKPIYHQYFGFDAKIETTAGGDVFPLGRMPPYLSLVEHWSSPNSLTLVSADPPRSVATACFRATGKSPNEALEFEKRKQVVEGVVVSRRETFFAALMLGTPLPLPYQALAADAARLGINVRRHVLSHPCIIDGRDVRAAHPDFRW